MTHFDRIDDYDAEIPAHVRDHFMARKIDYLLSRSRERFGDRALSFLDAGCGTGWHVRALRDAGHEATGLDDSERQIAQARIHDPRSRFVCGSMLSLPFPDASFDVSYAVNSLHHLPSRAAQETAFRELLRVTKPGGFVAVHEMNTRNPFIRFYLSWIFPRLKPIDTGAELWILPSHLQGRYGTACGPVSYFTFTPDFAPRALIPFFSWLERFLERTPGRIWSAHYAVTIDSSHTSL